MLQRRPVNGLDIRTPIEDSDTPTGGKNASSFAENSSTILKFMPDVGEEDESACGIRKLTSVSLCMDQFDVGNGSSIELLSQQR
jgi:hypothetical protein